MCLFLLCCLSGYNNFTIGLAGFWLNFSRKFWLAGITAELGLPCCDAADVLRRNGDKEASAAVVAIAGENLNRLLYWSETRPPNGRIKHHFTTGRYAKRHIATRTLQRLCLSLSVCLSVHPSVSHAFLCCNGLIRGAGSYDAHVSWHIFYDGIDKLRSLEKPKHTREHKTQIMRHIVRFGIIESE